MPLMRSPWREAGFIGVALLAAGLWLWASPGTPRWLPLVVVVAAGTGVMLALRLHARRVLPVIADADFIIGCGLAPPAPETALAIRQDVAGALGLPANRVSADAPLRDLMAYTAWFGSDLLALSEIQESVERRSGARTEVKPELSVRDVVRIVAYAEQKEAPPKK